MNITEAIVQFMLAGGSVVAATIIGRRAPYLGALVLLFPVKVLATLVFLPDGDTRVLGSFLVALIPGLLAVAAFALVAKLALTRFPALEAFGIGLIAWAVVAGLLAVVARPWI